MGVYTIWQAHAFKKKRSSSSPGGRRRKLQKKELSGLFSHLQTAGTGRRARAGGVLPERQARDTGGVPRASTEDGLGLAAAGDRQGGPGHAQARRHGLGSQREAVQRVSTAQGPTSPAPTP